MPILHARLRVILPFAVSGMVLIFLVMLVQLSMPAFTWAEMCRAVTSSACPPLDHLP